MSEETKPIARGMYFSDRCKLCGEFNEKVAPFLCGECMTYIEAMPFVTQLRAANARLTAEVAAREACVVSFRGLLEKAQLTRDVQPGSDLFTRYIITTHRRDLERMLELCQSATAPTGQDLLEDKAMLEWLMQFITHNAKDIEKLPWTLHQEEDLIFDRATIQRARSREGVGG
jgi:hypothetical protein